MDILFYRAIGFALGGVMIVSFSGTVAEYPPAFIFLNIVGIVFMLVAAINFCLIIKRRRKK